MGVEPARDHQLGATVDRIVSFVTNPGHPGVVPVSRKRTKAKKPRRSHSARSVPPYDAPDVLAARWDRILGTIIDRSVLPALLLLVVSTLVGRDPFGQDGVWLWVPVLAAAAVHEVVGTALWGQTLGKRLVGVRVVRADNFDLPGWRRAVMRTFGLAPLAAVPYGSVGAEIANDASFFLNRCRRAMHDFLGGTLVVQDAPWRRWASHS